MYSTTINGQLTTDIGERTIRSLLRRSGTDKINLSFTFLFRKGLLMTPRRRRRPGFTLIELLVVISIIGILVGLLLPAIGAAREAGRRAQCQSNLHNVTLGILGYVNQKNVFPPAGEFCEDATTNVAAANPPATSVILTWLPGSTTQRGVPMYSWVVPILPFLDSQDLSDQWTMWGTTSTGVSVAVPYVDQTGTYNQLGQATNHKIAQSALKVLQCPDDNTVQIGQGNLSYVVNGGFALWHAIPVGWNPAANGLGGIDGAGGITTTQLRWGQALGTTPQWVIDMANTQKLGVMFLESTFPQGVQTRIPWNIRSSIAAIPDGSSSTLMMSENTLTGVGGIAPYAATILGETDWACPLPNFTSFIGPSAVCGVPATYDCTAGQLAPIGDTDGIGWAFANKVGTFTNINGAKTLTLEGSYPFSNSGHPAGCNMGFCDGAVRFIANTIDSTVYSKIITPAGSKLPIYIKQMPVEQDAFVN